MKASPTAKPAISGLSESELTDWFRAENELSYRREQLEHWLYRKWVGDWDRMKTLPGALRRKLAQAFTLRTVQPLTRIEAEDHTCKWLFELADGETIETVLIRTARRNTLCLSTQVGCPVRCVFCASGQDGLIRNLTTAEIVDQVLAVCEYLGSRITHLVVMGMGEPLLNLEELLPALETICHPDRLGLGGRHVTISTSGIVPGIRRLAACGRSWHLALSLHGVTDEKRARLIPRRHRYPLRDILEACRTYRRLTGRIVTLEYALIAGDNDGAGDAAELARIARDLDAKVNVIPCNPANPAFQAPSNRQVAEFVDILVRQGVKVTLRRRKGDRIEAACGQLRRRNKVPG